MLNTTKKLLAFIPYLFSKNKDSQIKCNKELLAFIPYLFSLFAVRPAGLFFKKGRNLVIILGFPHFIFWKKTF